MDIPKNFADINSAREVAHSLYPEAKNITMVEYSYDNIVALIDDQLALRFPKNKNAYLRVIYEKHILEKLKNFKTITLPIILGDYSDPPYLITSFVPGHHISSSNVRSFSPAQQRDFAEEIALFAYTMHSTFSLEEELPLRKELGLDELEDFEPWPIYFKKTVHDYSFQTPLQEKIAKSHYAKWVKLCAVVPTIVVHDDLHTQNMMFEDNHLIGIVDFSDTNLGSPEQELRQLYRINEEVTLVAVQEYQRLSGQKLNIKAVKLWAIMQELAVFSKMMTTGKTDHHSFKRAARNLNTWLKEGEWGKGYDIYRGDVTQ
jgi:aminoglycoside phosphotransferase (APT) family kinase protein